MMINFIRRSWPALMETDVRKVSERDSESWLMKYQQQYAPTVVNNSIGTLRAIFDEAISTGARFNNPTGELSRVKVRAKRLELPSREEFLKFVDEIRTAGARQSKDCANLVRFWAYSGVRIGEAKFVPWADANFGRSELHVRGDPETATKNGETRYVPMIPELEQMLTELRSARSDEPPSAGIMRVFECQNSMTHAAEKIAEGARLEKADEIPSHLASDEPLPHSGFNVYRFPKALRRTSFRHSRSLRYAQSSFAIASLSVTKVPENPPDTAAPTETVPILQSQKSQTPKFAADFVVVIICAVLTSLAAFRP